ncbi:MAG: threonylcarbamoyl-AMP synthase [Alphaproteobacteria bacterium]|nr:threonylcarbamoyl-AMP synthase [Alphaproteobacteria bacterium]
MAPQNQPFATRIAAYGKAAVEEACRLILAGEPVAVPTETVYGLAADATNEEAVRRIYEAKGRPAFNPLIVHVRDLAQAEEIASFGDAARALALAWWPGPLTLVLPLKAGAAIAPVVTAGLATIALRCPAHPAMRALLEACGRPLAAPSANASGGISPTRADHVVKTLEGRIPLVVDGGETELGVESTIVAVDEDGGIRLLRPGPIDFAELAALASLAEGEGKSAIEAPGQLRSHYAPTKALRLDATAAEPDEWLIGFGAVAGDDSLSAKGDLREAAARLFHALHRAEAQAKACIAVAPVPEEGIGRAINDRLRRAASSRD